MKKILVIEDSPHMRENIAEILQVANYEVLTAGNGQSGIEIALEQRPDLIVCDVGMPGMDGYGVLHLINENTTLQHTPFIFLSNQSEEAGIRKALEMGADDYITKPFEETELLEAIEAHLSKAG